jgi:cold shock protein
MVEGSRTTAFVAGRTEDLPRPAPHPGPTTEDQMPKGTVKWFNTTKGYGFIAPDDGGKDVFVHISAVEQAGLTGLADNQKVDFDMIEGRDGRKMAGNLRKG